MTEQGRDPLADVAGAVADGTPVDWSQAKGAAGADREALEHLSILEKIKGVHSEPLAETVASPPPITSWGPLQVLEEIGRGGWGEVYRAFDPTLQMEVALKLLKSEEPWIGAAAERFLSEARRLARVHHPNVVIVHGADRHEGRYGIWTEFIRGQTLEKYTQTHGKLGPREAALIGLDLCRALSAVHAADLVHRDVKASNVMREDGGRIVLMDFGSGAEIPPGGDLKASRHIHGTPMAMAPEQLRGEIAGPATDVYGLGALLYWLVSGRYPIEASTFVEVVQKHARNEYVRLRDRRPDLPHDFVQVVERAIAPDPRNRYASAGAMEQALAVTLSHREQGRLARLGPTWLRSRWGGPVTAGAVVFIALVLFARVPPKNGTDAPPPAADSTAGRRLSPSRRALTATAWLRRLAPHGEESVTPGSRVAPGDRLSMLLEGSDSMYVYVLNEDRRGNVYVLFPIPGVAPANPLPPSVRHHLPGRLGDSLVYWNVTSAGGRESITAVASREPLEQWETLLRGFPRAVRGRLVTPNKVSPKVVRTLRGLGGISVEAQDASETSRRTIADAIRALEERRLRTGDIWIWTAELENPEPVP
jgi:serine/threonine protein kinase